MPTAPLSCISRRAAPAAVALALALLGASASAEPPVELEPVSAPTRQAGGAWVASASPDTHALGGFGTSSNAPVPAPPQLLAAGQGLHLELDLDASPVWRGHAGLQAWLVNSGREPVTLPASDSRISLVQEAQAPDGAWVAIEHLPQSWCGNSYHRVTLPAGQMWSVVQARYAGPLKTSLRLRLETPDGPVYSAPFDGAISAGQIEEETDHHRPGNIMDPYEW